MGFHSGINGGLMGYFWDIPSGSLKHGQLQKSLLHRGLNRNSSNKMVDFPAHELRRVVFPELHHPKNGNGGISRHEPNMFHWRNGEMSNERADMSMFFEIVASQMCSAIVCYSIRLSMVNAHQLGIQTSCTFAYRLAKRFSGC
jgi:hypothetical protein